MPTGNFFKFLRNTPLGVSIHTGRGRRPRRRFLWRLQLLLAAGRRCLLVATEASGVTLLIDAKDERAANWYASYGAVPLLDTPLSLLLPFKTIHAALSAADKL